MVDLLLGFLSGGNLYNLEHNFINIVTIAAIGRGHHSS